MPEISQKELSCIQDCLTVEQNLIEKYKLYASLCEDPQIKTKCEQIAAKHQAHFDRLMNQM